MPTSSSNIAGNLDIIARAGDTFNREFTFTDNEPTPGPIDLSTYTSIRLQVRESYYKPSVLSVDLSDYITVTGAGNNVVSVSIPGDLMRFPIKTYKWDLELTSASNVVITYLEGDFRLEHDVSR